MSSAKTIADILAFTELIDANSFIGSPYSSQCIYIAACAFLMESAYYSSSSRFESPPPHSSSPKQAADFTMPSIEPSASERNPNAKHSLLAAAAKENYQRCYKALKTLETYWAGIKYILTVLDQKAKGIWDPLLYTAEEMDSTVEESPVIDSSLGPPGWKLTQPFPNPTDSKPPSELKRKVETSSQARNVDCMATNSIDPTQGKNDNLRLDVYATNYGLQRLDGR